MNVNYIPFVSSLNNGSIDVVDIGFVSAVVAARYASTKLPLPTSEVTNTSQAYRDTALIAASEIISRLNEEFVFDTDFALELTRSFWHIRYQAAFPGFESTLVRTFGYFDTIVGTANFFSRDVHCKINHYKDQILDLVAKLQRIDQSASSAVALLITPEDLTAQPVAEPAVIVPAAA